MVNEVNYVLLGVCLAFFGNYLLIKRTEKRELEKTKSLLKLEFSRIYKILLYNIDLCEEIRYTDKEARKESKNREPDGFLVLSTFQNLVLDTIILHSLISTGSILNLATNEIKNI